MATLRIAVIAGDGIGPEVIEQAIRVADRAVLRGQRSEVGGQSAASPSSELRPLTSDLRPPTSTIEWNRLPWSSAYYKQHGRILPVDGWDILARHDAILFGAIGSPDVPDKVTVHDLLLPMRRKFDEYVNLRPAYLFEGVPCPLVGKAPGSIDMLVYRENTEGEYAPIGGRLYEGTSEEVAVQAATFTRRGCERIIRAAFEAARKRPRKKLTSITKSNALVYGMALWDEAAKAIARQYPDVQFNSLLVDAAAMDFVRKPESFDVVVASNLFGDILTDLSAAVAGSIGLASSANINPERTYPSMFEPVHGSAPDIAGKGIADPLAAILSAALMLDHLNESQAADAIRKAVAAVLREGKKMPPDLGGKAKTVEVGDAVLAAIG